MGQGKRAVLSCSLLLLGFGVIVPADASPPESSRCHEYVPPDPDEDVSLAATTLDGKLPAALRTSSGIASAPDPRRPPDPNHLYSGGSTDDSPDSTFPPDRDTSQPNVENYEDPFSPSTLPFKRLRAYDSVDADYTLKVANRSTSLMSVGGEALPEDEPFYADLSVELTPDELVRIPTVGPGSRVLKLHASPETQLTLLRDGAENWFVLGTEQKRVRLVMHLVIPRATFGSEFADPSWESLAPHVPEFAPHTAQARRVWSAIGVDRSMRPRDVVTKLVAYYRAFVPSDTPPKQFDDIYLDLALTKKGVCRHRAFAFLVTALELGIPTRMVVNEAHAWVEVFDSALWHRIDLGGAALDLNQDRDLNRPQHEPPADPFEWPEESKTNSGQALSDREAPEGGGDGPTSTDPNGSSALPDPDPQNNGRPDLPASTITVDIKEKTVRRGTSLVLSGEVTSQETCSNVRVDLVLKDKSHPQGRVIGSLSTDQEGRFEGSVVVPRDVTAGDYDVTVITRGNQVCGRGRSD